MDLHNILLFVVCIIIAIIIFKYSKRCRYKYLYIFRTISYTFILLGFCFFIATWIDINEVLNSLDTLTTISATLAGFVFSGISIIFGLLNVSHVKRLFKYDFLDKVFYKGYCVVICSLIDIAIYVCKCQLSKNCFLFEWLPNISEIVANVYLCFFWLSILYYSLMIYDFVMVINKTKIEMKENDR